MFIWNAKGKVIIFWQQSSSGDPNIKKKKDLYFTINSYCSVNRNSHDPDVIVLFLSLCKSKIALAGGIDVGQCTLPSETSSAGYSGKVPKSYFTMIILHKNYLILLELYLSLKKKWINKKNASNAENCIVYHIAYDFFLLLTEWNLVQWSLLHELLFRYLLLGGYLTTDTFLVGNYSFNEDLTLFSTGFKRILRVFRPDFLCRYKILGSFLSLVSVVSLFQCKN